MIPPAAISGMLVTAATSASSRRSGTPGGPASRSAEKVPRWAPASGPWTHNPSAPREAASAASSGVVTVTQTTLPAARSAAMTPGSGQPKVKLTTAGGRASRAVAVMGTNAYRDPGAIKVFDADYGFNLPWYGQYFLWLSNLARGNLGFSWTLNQSVASLLATALPKTIALVGLSTLLALVVAIPMGVLQAVRRNKLTDHALNTTSTIFYATPDFLIGIIGILAFAIVIPIFPPEGPQGAGVGSIITDFNALILPICCLSLTTIALFSRYMRSSVLDNLTEDYVRTAGPRGASERGC
jgi:ABC-type microcin C transport system permease subunit YejB